MQLKVIKADGMQEGYLHTKVIAAFVNALAKPQEDNALVARQLAEAVTFYLYNKYGRDKITSSEIFSIIQAVLSSTGCDDAAVNLTEHHCRRNLLRARVEVTKPDIQKISDAVKLRQVITAQPVNCSPRCDRVATGWNKSKIINDLVTEYNLDSTTARTVASIVEEKILSSGFRCVTAEFVRFLVICQTQAILSAQQQLQHKPDEETAASYSVNNAVMDGRLRQPQNGLCPVEV